MLIHIANFFLGLVLIAAVLVLHVDIMPPKDENENPVAMKYRPKDGLVS